MFVLNFIEPNLAAGVFPPLIIGNSGMDNINLLCTTMVMQNLASSDYTFTWMKDGSPLNLSDNRIMVYT